MDRDLLRRALFILSVSSIVSFSSLKLDQKVKRENVKKYLFENQVNFLTKNYKLTKEDSIFVVKEISSVLKDSTVSFHAKQLSEYVEYYRNGALTRKSCYPAFDRFYESFTKSFSNQKVDSLYSVLSKYSSFKDFEKQRKVSELIFKSKFRNYFLDKYLNAPKPELKPPRYDTRLPKTYFTKEKEIKKKPLVKRKV